MHPSKGFKKKNVYRHKNGYYSVKFYITYMLHLSLEAEFCQIFRSYFKFFVRLVVFDLWWKMRQKVDFSNCQVKKYISETFFTPFNSDLPFNYFQSWKINFWEIFYEILVFIYSFIDYILTKYWLKIGFTQICNL